MTEPVVVVGGNGYIGRSVTQSLLRAGTAVTVLDRCPPVAPGPSWLAVDLLEEDAVLPPGRIVLAAGASLPRPRRPWTLALDNALSTARLAPSLGGRTVVLLSSAEVYGWAPAPLREDTPPVLPVPISLLEAWVERALQESTRPCTPWRTYRLCSELADLDPSGRWVYALAKLAQELVVRSLVPPERLTVLRVANVVGPGQVRAVNRFVHAAQQGHVIRVSRDTRRSFVSLRRVAQAAGTPLPGGTYNVADHCLLLTTLAELVALELGVDVSVELVDPPALDSCGVVDGAALDQLLGPSEGEAGLRRVVRAVAVAPGAAFDRALPVVLPPRPERPDLVADRQQAALWSGQVKYGGRWTVALEFRLRAVLAVPPDREVLATASGTAALRLAVLHAVPRPAPGAVAVLPSFTFAATGEVLSQLGFRLRFADVTPDTWTLDPVAVEACLRRGDVALVVAVDTLGNPADYEALLDMCAARDVPLVADSAPALGARYQGRPVGDQVGAHAFSMSFAKVVSAGGAGGALSLSAADHVPAAQRLSQNGNWWRSSQLHEVHAIAALDQLDVLDQLVQRRAAVADVYEQAARHWPGVVTQRVRSDDRHAYVHWVARFGVGPGSGPTEMARRLAAEGVGTKPYYGPLVHRLLAGECTGSLPVTEALAEQALALPMSSEMTVEDAERVVIAVDRSLGLTRSRPRARVRAYPDVAQRTVTPAPSHPVRGG